MSKQLTLSSLLSVIFMIGFIAANSMVPETILANSDISSISPAEAAL
jgi:uncharacterized membrane protein YciS (DUF1049 family)